MAAVERLAVEPHPVLDLAARWLEARAPEPRRRVLVHGDYRVGNVMFDASGVRAILDWELVHLGDPVEDLGWLCVRAWRFGNDALPVGGVGTREELVRAYEAAGGEAVDREALRYWEVCGNFKLALVFIMQCRAWLDGAPSLELASLGRRTAEAEQELLELMEGPSVNDRPTGVELLRAVERFLEQEVVPALEGPRRYHARVAANVVAIVAREIETEEAQLQAEWERLGVLLGLREDRPGARDRLRDAVGARTRALVERIRRGDADQRARGAPSWSRTCGARWPTSSRFRALRGRPGRDSVPTLRTETEAGVRRIVLCRAEAYNTITPELRDELAAAVDAGDADPEVHVMLLCAEGPRLLRRLRPRLGDGCAGRRDAPAHARCAAHASGIRSPICG